MNERSPRENEELGPSSVLRKFQVAAVPPEPPTPPDTCPAIPPDPPTPPDTGPYNTIQAGFGKTLTRPRMNRTYRFSSDVGDFLDTLPKNQKTAWLERAIRAQMAHERKPDALLTARLHELRVEVGRLQTEALSIVAQQAERKGKATQAKLVRQSKDEIMTAMQVRIRRQNVPLAWNSAWRSWANGRGFEPDVVRDLLRQLEAEGPSAREGACGTT